MIKKLSLGVLLSAAGLFPSIASAEGWIGYMSWFENNGGVKGAYVSGGFWSVPDLKTTVTVSSTGTYIGDQLTLQPNYNTYADNVNSSDPVAVAYWTDGAGGGNKFMEANTFVEFIPITQPTASFSGSIDSYTLEAGYTAFAFVKVLDPDLGYATVLENTVDLSSGSSFTVNADLAAYQGKLLQMGFVVKGINANPVNEIALGGVNVTITVPSAIPEPSAFALIGAGAVGAFAALRRRRR